MKMLAFVESQMNTVAPNVSAIVGTTIAAKLIGAAGGLDKLAELPSTVVQILGSKKKTLGGMSTTSQVMHAGVMKDADIIENTPPAFRSKILRLVRGRAIYAPAAYAAPPYSLHAPLIWTHLPYLAGGGEGDARRARRCVPRSR